MAKKQKPKILVTAEMGHLSESRAILEKYVQPTYAPSLSRRQLLRMTPAYDAILTNLRQKIDREVIEAGLKLKLIATASTGTDHIDVPYAESRGITVQSLKKDYEILKTITSTAEHAFLLMLACLRRLPFSFDDVRRGRWHAEDWRGREAAGRTVGIIGYGRLGEIFSRLANGFAMNVIAYDPLKKITDSWVEQVTMKELLKHAEIITIHVHLTPQTRGLIGAGEFAHMRRGVYLINTSRGAVLDEKAFLQALRSGKIACAGIDVLAGEPEVRTASEPLVRYARAHKNLIITPHLGGCTYDAQEKAFQQAAAKVTLFFKNLKFYAIPTEIRPALAEIKKLMPFYESMLLNVLKVVLNRYDRDPHYHFIDTKLSVITGRDFDDSSEPARNIRGKEIVYSWIQGRGLEALARHAEWLKQCRLLPESEKKNYTQRITKLLRQVAARMEKIRRTNRGKLSFCFNRLGRPLKIVNCRDVRPLRDAPPAGSNLSDLFYAKGLLAAASFCQDNADRRSALKLLRSILDDIAEGRFYNDAQCFDPKNRVNRIPGQYSHVPWMIGISAAALASDLSGAAWCFDTGARFIRHVLLGHVNLGQHPQLKKYDFFELRDDQNQPVLQDGDIICDPGHTLEFIGLSAKFLNLMQKTPFAKKHTGLVATCREIFPEMFIHAFRLGFNPMAGGICKSFDLAGRRPRNTDLPWWNLPETMRAGMELLALGAARKYDRHILKIIALCSNSFVKNYVNPTVMFMAYQVRNAKGRVIDTIPATPDADPCYHTGLSMIDFLAELKRQHCLHKNR